MNKFFNWLAAFSTDIDADFDENFGDMVEGTFKFAYIIWAIMAVVAVAIIITVVVLIIKNSHKIGQAGKGMAGAIKETFNTAGDAINKAVGNETYSTCAYCGGSVKSSDVKCPHCGTSVKHKSK